MPRPILDPNKNATVNTTPRVNVIFCGSAIMIDTYDCCDEFYNEFMPRLNNECSRAQREHISYTEYSISGRPTKCFLPAHERPDLVYLIEPMPTSNVRGRQRKVMSLMMPSGIISVEDVEEICDNVICSMCDIPEGYFKGIHMADNNFNIRIIYHKYWVEEDIYRNGAAL